VAAPGQGRAEVALDDGGTEAALRGPPAAPPAPRRPMSSGIRSTSSARARCGRRRMKPRSSRPVIRRWMPDFERRLSASFISSKDGETPLSRRRMLMKDSSSNCLRVSMLVPPIQCLGWLFTRTPRYGTKPKRHHSF
jgi:hypothetical protein